jgi:transcription elongation factor Elf1
MACPTCDHAVSSLGATDGVIHYHCPRCGTVVAHYLATPGAVSVYVPMLVDRCRKFEAVVRGVDNGAVRRWHSYGIAESINVPAGRPE